MFPEQSISEGVRKNGFRILSIGDHKPPFAYTVGLMFTQQNPELIIFGLREAGPDILRAAIKMFRGWQARRAIQAHSGRGRTR